MTSEQSKNERVDTTKTRKERWQKVLQLLDELSRAYPGAFPEKGKARLPLKVGIHLDITAHFADQGTPVSASLLRQAMAFYMSRMGYLRACQENANRVDLQGQTAGTVSKKDAAYAKEKLTEIRSKLQINGNEQQHKQRAKKHHAKSKAKFAEKLGSNKKPRSKNKRVINNTPPKPATSSQLEQLAMKWGKSSGDRHTQ